MRTKILNNIGVTMVKLGKYEDALATFEDCLEAGGNYGMALNSTLTVFWHVIFKKRSLFTFRRTA